MSGVRSVMAFIIINISRHVIFTSTIVHNYYIVSACESERANAFTPYTPLGASGVEKLELN